MKTLKKTLIGLAVLALFSFDKKIVLEEKPESFKHQKLSKVKPFQEGEKLSYRAHYGWLDAGTADLTIIKQDTAIDGNPVFHALGEGKTLSVFEWFYKVRDVYETYMDESTLAPRKFKRRVNEGGYIINRDYHFVPEQAQVNTAAKGTIKTPVDVQDMLSSFYYLRALDFSNAKQGQIFRINAFMDYEMWPFYVKYRGIEEVNVSIGTFKCHKFVPVVQEGRIFKSEEDMSVWVTADANKIPILIESKILVGSVKLEISGYGNLIDPIAKIDKKNRGWF
ncbi:MAG: DUF3108 domain-containing protein [Salibacteraceae bacterium]|nr:DUF3108 domain-containing protein [Salibacteraceae bacterium]|tara:strand:- start:45502 stop:46338 length:837 start_codon:yes stop_codon:yes gene_type:complete